MASAFSAMAMLSSCGGQAVQSAEGVEVPEEVKVGDIVIKMKNVEGGTFAMGLNPNGTKIPGASLHQVVLNGYAISEFPVTQELWTAVTGSQAGSTQNPSAPVDMVSFDDCVKFIGKLSKLTKIPFSLPTEAQWEYASCENVIKVNPNYSEWCADVFVDGFGDSLMVNPICEDNFKLRVARTPKARTGESNFVRKSGLSLRLVVNTNTAIPEDVVAYILNREVPREEVSSNEVIKVGKSEIQMVGVKGGTFSMGVARGADKMADSDESPAHKVTLKGFEIGKTEVTAGLWLEVMGKLPYKNNVDELNKPVVNVSWYDCQEFIIKLNRLTGRKFRLPTEAEWEFAARGGNQSLGNRFAGSNYASQVASYASKDVVNVKKFAPNELGIYDMSGNAWEWCQDSPYDYEKGDETDPCCNDSSTEFHIMRGGSSASKWDACRVTNRSKLPGSSVKATFGLRLAL